MTLNKRLSIAMRIRRGQLGLSQLVLSKKAKISQSTIAQLENGRKSASLATVEKLAKGLGCDPIDLFRETKLTMEVK